MKSIKMIIKPSLFLMVVLLLHYAKIWQHEVTKGTKFTDAVAKNETNLLNHNGFRRNIRFEPNLGQADNSTSFIARGNGYNLFLNSNEAILSFQNSVNHITGAGFKSRAGL